jgi:hypothetical protein
MSIEIYEKLKKIFEDSIENRKIELKDVYTIVEAINKEMLLMKAWCLDNVDKGFEKLCNDFETSASLIIRALTQFALNKAVLGQANIGEDEVSLLLKHILKIIEEFSRITQKTLLVADGGTLCKVIKPFQIRHSIALPGYVAYLPLALALHLSTIGFVEIIEIF